MTMGVHPVIAMAVALLCCLVCGVINGTLVGKFKLPPFIATLGTMFAARGVAYMVNNNRNTDAIATGIGKEAGDSFQNLFYYGKTFGIYNTFWIALILFLIFFSCCPEPGPGAIFTPSAPMWRRQNCPAWMW